MESIEREHLEDEDIVRLMDDEGSVEEQEAAEAHLRSCDACRLRSEAMHSSSVWLRTNVALLDPASPDDIARARALERMRGARALAADSAAAQGARRVRGVGGWGGGVREGGTGRRLIAAGIGVILLAGLTVEPVRAWIRDGFRELSGRPEVAMEVARVEAPVPAPSAASARFVVTGPSFRIDVAEPQEEGTLTLRVIPGEEVSVEIVGGVGETLVVLPSALRVGNLPGSTASYIVELPSGGVREIEVRVGGRVVERRALSTVTEALNVTLAPEDGTP